MQLFSLPPSLPRLSPWIDWSEWSFVYHSLLSSSSTPSTQLQAISIITAWKTRGKTIPIPIETTAAILSLSLKQSTLPPHVLLRLHSLLLLRLVNGILDPLQTRSYALSLTSLAKTLSFPRFLVDLRHEITHQKEPNRKIVELGIQKGSCPVPLSRTKVRGKRHLCPFALRKPLVSLPRLRSEN